MEGEKIIGCQNNCLN